jgi:hypothetical protein
MRSQTYSEKTDVWSWACTIFELVAREMPFAELDLMSVRETMQILYIHVLKYFDFAGIPSSVYLRFFG